jgi:hypothetical protein
LADEGKLTANVYFISGGSCAPVPGLVRYDYFAHCSNLPGLLADLVRRENVQSVVLGASWLGYRADVMFVEREGVRFALNTRGGQDAFYANLEDYIRTLQGHGAKVYLVLGSPIHSRFDPNSMVTRSPSGIHVLPGAGKAVSVVDLRGANASADVELRKVAQNTGAALLDPVPDICEHADGCSPLFEDGEPKFSDGMHLRPAFVRRHLLFLDFLLK